MSVKRAFFSIFQKIMVVCCAIFFGFTNAFAANLPSGYTELEYIESTGTQYIDTGVIPNQNYKMVLDARLTENSGGEILVGSRVSYNSRGFSIVGHSGGSKWAGGYGDNSGVSEIASDLNRHTFEVGLNGFYIDNTKILTYTQQTFTAPGNLVIGAVNNNGEIKLYSKAKFYSFKLWNGSTLVRNFVPAKNSSGVVGMYDTVNNRFYTTQGTGTFTAGPVVQASLPNEYQEIMPFDTILYPQTLTGWKQRVVTGADNIVNYGSDLGLFYLEGFDNKVGAPLPGVVSNNFKSVKTNGWAKNDDKYFETRFQMSGDTVSSHRLYFRLNMSYTTLTSAQTYFNEHPTTVLYLPETPTDNTYVAAKRISDNTVGYYCVSGTNRGSFVPAYGMTGSVAIKIATTAYNTAQFNPVVTDLNSTIATIRSVVTNTINQTKAIADLQAKKQTRPDEQCPAGKKCLLVEDNNGTPHWYEIIENIYGLPAGYTALEYIQSDGNSWIDTGIKGNMSYKYDIEFQQLDAGQYRNWGAFNQQTYNGGPNMSLTYATGFAVRWTVTGSAEQLVNEMSSLDTNRHHLVIDNGYVTWDGVAKGRSGGHRDNYILSYNLFLGTVNPGGTTPTANAKSKYYSYKVWNGNGDLIQNFVPAKNSSGVVGMYDLADPNPATAFHTNKGTGTFIGKEF